MVESSQSGNKAVFETFIRGTAEAVWAELTKTHEPQAAMFNAIMHAPEQAPGAPLQMRTKNGKFTSVVGEFLVIEPPRKLSHTLRFTAYDDPHTVVTYEIEPEAGDEGEGVRFRLTVEGMLAGTKTSKSMMQGGPMICTVMKAVVETGKPPLWYRALGGVFEVLGAFTTPAKCKTENWA